MPRPVAVLSVCVLFAMLLLSGCGGDGEDSSDSTKSTATTGTAPAVSFPRGGNKTMRALRASAPEQAVFAPSVSQLRPGRNRIGFALFDTARAQVEPDAVAVYVSQNDGRRLRGPFVARQESLRVKPQFMSRQTAADLDDVDSFWVADVPLERRGQYILTALVSIDGELASTSQIEMRAGQRGGPPDVGEEAIRVSTDTVASAAGNLESIDTRIPPLAELHEDDFADVLGKEPVVLAFATPQLCQTRVCGPVVDVVAEVKSSVGEGVKFIHQEIYVDNDINKGFRPQVGKWRLPTEPWTFVIGRDGRVVERFEGALSVNELTAAVEKLKSS
ncbi:MAG TPA: thioredoxin family protein [Solirubrobacteraceae bacterium]|nr:thioredoxin family protein [Solirubrobacteraceae bacterium]